LANHKSAIKRAKQNEGRNIRNKSSRTRIKNVVKAVRGAVEEQSRENAQAALAAAIPVIRRAANKGAIHHKNASRKISRLTRQVNTLSA
jgi:small subunit ribosomal protein S20